MSGVIWSPGWFWVRRCDHEWDTDGVCHSCGCAQNTELSLKILDAIEDVREGRSTEPWMVAQAIERVKARGQR